MKIKSNRKKRFAIFRLSAIIFALLSLIGLYIGGTKQTYADSISLSESDIKAYEQSIFYKIKYNHLKRCYSYFGEIGDKNKIEKIKEALTDEGKNLKLDYTYFDSYSPSFYKDDSYSYSCEDLLGDRKISDFLDEASGFYGADTNASRLDSNSKKCFYVSAKIDMKDKEYKSGDYCIDVDNNSGYVRPSGVSYLESKNTKSSSYDIGDRTENSFDLNGSLITTNGSLCYSGVSKVDGGYGNKNLEFSEEITVDNTCLQLPITYDNFIEYVKSIIKSVKKTGTDKKFFSESSIRITDSTNKKGTRYFKLGDDNGANKFASSFLEKTKGIDGNKLKLDNGKFSDAEKYIIYRNTLKAYYQVSISQNKEGDQVGVSWLTESYAFKDDVYLTPQNNTSELRYVPYNDTLRAKGIDMVTDRENKLISYYWHTNFMMSASEIIAEMSKINVAEAFNDKPTALIDDGGNGNGGSDSSEDFCTSSSGSLGWILCPIINTVHGMIDGVYEKLESWLQINSKIVTKLGSTDTADNGLFNAWTTFRNIANIAFVILFMIIIFSQLTGYGIDNYGIKRMLPKLIVTAILVNLSYVICGLLVDISNIVGNSVKGLFESMAGTSTATNIIGSDSAGSVKSVVGYILGVGGAVVGLGIAAWVAGPLPILLFVVAIAIGAFTILIILGMRQALVIALIVASPLALVCMILPNTEGIYKKWLNAFKGLLIVYPIIGAVIGAGYFAASILLSVNQDVISIIISGILMIAPYFMIPSLTRKSLDAIGSIGSRISSFGQRGSGRAQNGVRNSNFGKSMQQNHEYGKAKRYMEGGFFRKKFKKDSRGQKLADKINAGKKVSIRSANKYQQMANLASAREQANIGARTAQSKYSRLQNTGYDASLSAAASAEEDAAIKDYETQIRNGDFKAAFIKEVKNKDGEMEKKLIADRAPEGDNELAAALEYELKLGQAADKNKIIALQNVLSKTDGGRNAMVESINSALQERDGNGNRIVSSTSVKALASNIMANQGDYKGVHRSIYEWAKDVLKDKNRKDDTTEVNMSNITDIDRTSGILALTPSSFLSTDATQMQQYVEFYKNSGNRIKEIENQLKNGKITEEDANTEIEAINNKRIRLEEIAHSIAYNPNVHSSIRKDDYGEALKLFAADIPWDNVFSGRGVEVQISHNNETQPEPVQTQQTSQPTQPEPVQTQQTSQPEPTQAQPVDNTNSINSKELFSKFNQSFEQQDYNNRLKEETARRDDLSDENKQTINKWIDNSNNQKPNNS